MRSFFATTLGCLATLSQLVQAAPSGLETREVPCDDISTYTVQYWLDAQYLFPRDDTCLFYTFDLTGDAVRYAQGTLYVTIWDFWACRYYDGRTDNLDNSLRCIFADADKKRQYFRNMSEAMARRCGGKATVMTKDVDNIPQNGIWGQTEQPTLQRAPDSEKLCTSINVFDTFGNNEKTIWTRPTQKRRSPESEAAPLNQRSDGLCYSADQLQSWFGDVDW